MKKSHLLLTAAVSLLTLSAHADMTVLQPLATFGTRGDGSIQPGDLPFLSASSQLQRGLAFNPITGHLLVVDRSSASSANNDVYVLDGATGQPILDGSNNPLKLDNSSILTGGNASFLMNLVGVADDGAIYVCNLSNGTDSNNPQFRLYRWENENSLQTFVFPSAPGVADPGNGVDNTVSQKRWGDTMVVRGSGINTEVLVANRGTLLAIFKPTDESMTTFAPVPLTSNAGVGALGHGITFGAGNTFWGTGGPATGGPLYQMEYNVGTGTATKILTNGPPVFPGTIAPLLYIGASNLLAGITMVTGPDIVRLYDMSNPAAPVLLDRESFITSNNNNTYSGALSYGNGVLYALDSDNGLMAFSLTTAASNPMPPAFYQSPASDIAVVGSTVTLTAAADGESPISYQWRLGTNDIADATNATLVLVNVQTNHAGVYSVLASNANGTATSGNGTLTVVATSPTTLLAYDPFTNAPGATIAGQNDWRLGSGTVSPVASAGNLSYTGLADSIGNQITWGTSTMTLQRTNFSIVSDSIYVSFLYRLDPSSTVPAVGASGGAVAGFQNNTESSVYYGKVTVRTNSSAPNSYFLGISKRGGENLAGFATNALSLGDTVFVVSRYKFNPNASDDAIDLWINPDPATFGASNAPIASVGDGGISPLVGTAQTDTALIDRFTFRHSSGPSRTYVDEVRIGLAWSDVTPTPAPATPPGLVITRSGSNVTVTWPATHTGFTLEGTGTLSSPSWSTISHSTVGNDNTATIPAGSGNQFLRLRK